MATDAYDGDDDEDDNDTKKNITANVFNELLYFD